MEFGDYHSYWRQNINLFCILFAFAFVIIITIISKKMIQRRVYQISRNEMEGWDFKLQHTGEILQNSDSNEEKIPAFAPRGAAGARNDRCLTQNIPLFYF